MICDECREAHDDLIALPGGKAICTGCLFAIQTKEEEYHIEVDVRYCATVQAISEADAIEGALSMIVDNGDGDYISCNVTSVEKRECVPR